MTVTFISRSSWQRQLVDGFYTQRPRIYVGPILGKFWWNEVTLGQYIFAYSGFRPSVSFRQYTVTHINLKAILITRTNGRRLGTFTESSAFSYRGEFDKKHTHIVLFHFTHINLNATLILRKAREVWIISNTAMFLRKSEALERNVISLWCHQFWKGDGASSHLEKYL